MSSALVEMSLPGRERADAKEAPRLSSYSVNLLSFASELKIHRCAVRHSDHRCFYDDIGSFKEPTVGLSDELADHAGPERFEFNGLIIGPAALVIMDFTHGCYAHVVY